MRPTSVSPSNAEDRKRVAVIGTGVAGMSAAYFLSDKYDVSVYEAAGSPGMDASSIELNGGVRVDVPIRSFSTHYYPNLVALYRHIGIPLQKVDYCQSLSHVDGETVFDYKNISIWSLKVPLTNPIKHGAMAIQFLAFQLRCWWYAGDKRLSKMLFIEYLEEASYSQTFTSFLLNICSNMLSCSFGTVRTYPADILVEFFGIRHTTLLTGWLRAESGAKEICERLLAKVPKEKQYYNTFVKQIEVNKQQDETTVIVDGKEYDIVVVATEANQAVKFLSNSSNPSLEQATDVLKHFKYEKSCACVHSDPGLMPRNRSMWRTMNNLIPQNQTGNRMSSVTVWMNQLVDVPKGMGDVFQTWNPHVRPSPSHILSEATFSRAVHTIKSADTLSALAAIQGNSNIYFCGSYASRGMTLLEQAVSSSLLVATTLGCPPPFPVEGGLERRRTISWHRTAAVALVVSMSVAVMRLLV